MSFQKDLLAAEAGSVTNDDFLQLASDSAPIAPSETFFQAFAFGDEFDRYQAFEKLRQNGLTDDDLIDLVIPETARRIGELWTRDEMSFGQVTIAATHLQELVRTISGNPDRLATTIPLGLSILIVIPAGETHTMGAFVAADQFRRLGLMVHLAICQTPAEIANVVKNQNFAMIGISSASRRRLQEITDIVKCVRNSGVSTPIVLGGNIVKIVPDVLEVTGVDLATSNAGEAARFCGLPVANDVLKGPLF